MTVSNVWIRPASCFGARVGVRGEARGGVMAIKVFKQPQLSWECCSWIVENTWSGPLNYLGPGAGKGGANTPFHIIRPI